MTLENSNPKNLNSFKFICLFFVLLGLCLYFNKINYYAGSVRSYFLAGFSILFFCLGLNFIEYNYTSYRKHFKDNVLKFTIYAAIFLLVSFAIVLFKVFTQKNNLKFTTNVSTAINNTPFLFANLWFIPTYFILLLLLPALNKFITKLNYSPVVFASILLIIVFNELIAPIIPNNAFSLRDVFISLRYILFYGFFALLGLSYNRLITKHKENESISALLIILLFALIAACVFIYGYNSNLYKQMYPPTFFFSIYQLLIFTVAYYFLPKINKLLNTFENKKFIRFASDYMLEIILILPFVLFLFSLLFNATNVASFFDKYFILGFLTYFIGAVLIIVLCFFVLDKFKNRTNNLKNSKNNIEGK